ncbi:hypothetical protein JTE90_009843 [Oedothorax gibbosus]|uniref:Uncharacterized protein n=1 Tax=Oedothorax gibbosus TaxID=931172 RepID=A0AAV6TX96_9ARAC|nr:hypothetical protein JTE90_009843 [Oedothorax gibbosus]
MSVICQTFVQNTWRSDLCSNCFKCREEHGTSCYSTSTSTPSSRYMPQATSLYQSRGLSTSLKWRLSSEPIYERVARRDFGSQTLTKASCLLTVEPEDSRSRGILVTSDKRRRSRSSVDFASEEALVIGYGGNDYDSDQSPWEMGSDDGSVDLDLLDDNDDDRKITRMTRNNTEFNSSNRNLSIPPLEEESKKRNNNKTSPSKTANRTLDILTYNDIQTPQEKKLNQYYFPSSTEQHSFLHGKVVNGSEKNKNQNLQSSVKVDNCRKDEDNRNFLSEENSKNIVMGESNRNFIKVDTSRSHVQDVNSRQDENGRHILKDENVMNHVKERNSRKDLEEENARNFVKEEDSNNLLKNDFSPLNTKTYSFVSELNKSIHVNSEHSSDSDYSTCRLTAGDSTDSESFQDAEDSRIAPCSSFLHGNFPPQQKVILHQSLASLEIDKKYDAGSSTSGDVSNLSDDSDASERTSFKSRNIRTPKTSTTDSKRSVKEVNFSDTHSVLNKNDAIELHGKTDDEKAISSESKTIEVSQNEYAKAHESNALQKAPNPKNLETISINIDSKQKPKLPDTKPPNSPSPNPPVDLNLRNIIAVNGCPTTKIEIPVTNGHKIVTKTKSSPPRIAKPLMKSEVVRTKSLDSISEQQSKVSKPYVEDCYSKEPSDDDDYEKSPEAINNRQSKLAALALELELARRDSALKSASKSQQPSITPCAPAEIKVPSSPPEDNYLTIKKGSAISCASRLNVLPDVLQETPTKTKKNRFSLKKLLKRNKDSGTFSPAAKESNPKAWKKQTFDRSRLSLEIVHPMDMVDCTPVDEGCIFKGGYGSRAKSLSALPQDEFQEQNNCSLIECRKMDTLPSVRKAGTVAERKKNRPSLVRTPSCSAIPNRPASQHPPPKPPPPPKHKVAHPPPPPSCPHPRARAPATPTRPPPPKIPEEKCRTPSGDSSKHDSDKEYANLGDIRSQLMPVKPHRPSALSVPRGGSEPEEDHYTYLDDQQQQQAPSKSPSGSSVSSSLSQDAGRRPWLDLHTSYQAIAAANYESLAEIIATSLNESCAEYFRTAGKSLKWRDFALDDCQETSPIAVLQDKRLYNATHRAQGKEIQVMLMVCPRKQCSNAAPQPAPASTLPRVRFPVLASFCDACYGGQWSWVHVLRRSRVLSVSQFAAESNKDTGNQHLHLRDHCFLLLQVIHALKGLQAEGVEEVNCDQLFGLAVSVPDSSSPPVFVLLPEDRAALCEEGGGSTLCQATRSTLLHLLQAKGLLEYMLWGPVDLRSSGPLDDAILQRWLDLQRAQMVKSAIAQLQNNSTLHVYEEYQLVFLLQASVKSLKSVISKL